MRRTLLVLATIFLVSIGYFLIRQHQSSGVVDASTPDCMDVAASPDYLSSNSAQDAIAAINHAREGEQLPALRLPANFYQLDPPHQQFVLLNLERSDRGLRPLQWDGTLTEMALAYSRQLLDLHFFSHTSPIGGTFDQRMNGNVVIANHYSQAAENLAGNPVAGAGAMYEYMYDDAVEACGHRHNILNPALTLVGISWLRGSIYGSISAQEFLTSAAWNPYTGTSVVASTPQVRIFASTPEDGSRLLQCQAVTKDSIGIARITWFLDGLSHPLHVGASLLLDTRRLSSGEHTLLVYAVDGEQHYAVARYAIEVFVGAINRAPTSLRVKRDATA
ncbi:MAG: hypothetical protein NVSMB27_19870 [Ktedonobacteraceae bacterium]